MNIDTIIVNARIRTRDPERPEASSLGIWNGSIVGLGEDLAGLTATQVVDVDGAVVAPGFHDAHCHTTSFGMAMTMLDLSEARGMTALLDAVRDEATRRPTGEWVIGTGYGKGLAAGEHPTAEDLEFASQGRPVWLTHASGHMCAVSSSAIALLRLSTGQQEAFDRMSRDDSGSLSGLLEELDMDIVKNFHGPSSLTRLAQAIDRATTHYVCEGITSFTDAGVGGPGIEHGQLEIAAYQLAQRNHLLHGRAHLMVYSEMLHELSGHEDDLVRSGLDLGIHTGFGDGRLSLGAVKFWVDGSGLANTAATAGTNGEVEGQFTDDPHILKEAIITAARAGWQVAAHAMGDAAVDLVIEALTTARRRDSALQRPPARTRHRIEHGGLIRRDQIEKLARLGMVVVVQPAFIAEFGDQLRDTLAMSGTRLDETLRVRSLLQAGVRVGGSSDRPVTRSSPLQGIQAMVQRVTETGQPFNPAERVSAEVAMTAFTEGAEYAAGTDLMRGRLAPRHDADLVLLDDDPIRVEPSRIGQIKVLATIIAGETAYDPAGIFGDDVFPERSDPDDG